MSARAPETPRSMYNTQIAEARGLLWAMSADLVAAIVEAFNADVEELRLVGPMSGFRV